jgi:nitric oxide reductase NorQ protein
MTVTTRPAGEAVTKVLMLQPRADFVETPAVHDLSRRALAYLQAGFPIHFRGPAGTGKTTLALHVAAQLGRPVMLISGDEEFTTSDLIGNQNGYHYRKVVDRFVHNVLKYEEDAAQHWVDNRLTTACRDGFTLVYDEFTRSRPEANNVLLTVLEEGLLVLPTPHRNESYVKVHPSFRAIFTSNPQEYAGVHEAQDALSDRLVTIDVDYFERDTEINITAQRAGIDLEDATRIVDVVRDFRQSGEYLQPPSMRACIMIGRMLATQSLRTWAGDPSFVRVCLDVLESRTPLTAKHQERRIRERSMLVSLIEHYCSDSACAVEFEQASAA